MVTLTLSGTANVPLVGGQVYWLGLVSDSSSTFILWSNASNTAATEAAFSTDGGASYPAVGSNVASAFDVNAVPEPSTWAMLGAGAGLLAMRPGRRARVSA